MKQEKVSNKNNINNVHLVQISIQEIELEHSMIVWIKMIHFT